MRKKLFFSAGQVGRIIGVSRDTVVRMIGAGTIQGFRLPGTYHPHRVSRTEVIRFCQDHGIPLDALPGYQPPEDGLVLGPKDLAKVLSAEVPEVATWHQVDHPFEAGVILGEHDVHVLVVDMLCIGRTDLLEIGRRLRERPDMRKALFLALCCEDWMDETELRNHGYDDFWRHPVDEQAVVDRVRGYLSRNRKAEG